MVPSTVQSGTTFVLKIDLADYHPSEWSASLILRGADQIDIEATPDGNFHVFSVDAQTTSSWPAGRYWYCLRIEKDGEVLQIEDGNLQILPNLPTVTAPFDGRNHVQKVLDAIEAVIENRATKDQESYAINNRQLRRTPIADLLKLRDRYKEELRRQALAKKSGSSLLGRPVFVRFGS